MNKTTVIIGGGVIGLSVGCALLREGRRVVVFDRGQAGQGTAWLAAGMLGPDVEIGFEELELYRFGLESLRRWPQFVQTLEQETGIDLDYRTEGTFMVADDLDSATGLRRLFQFQKDHACDVEWLTGYEALDLEPFLAPRLTAAIFSRSNHQIDNRAVMKALRIAFEKRGGVIHDQTPVQTILPDQHTPAIVTAAGTRVEAETVILAAGAWSRQVEGLAEAHRPPVRPVKGQVVELTMEAPFGLRHVVRGPGAYLAPKSNGRLVVGATSEEMGFDTRVTAGGMYRILEAAWEVVPGIFDLPVTDSWAGLRPGSRDHSPLLGASGAPGVLFATGHYRHGVLLAPITAQEMARLVVTGETSTWLQPFLPERFF